MSEHRTTEKECPDCSGFHRCDYHEGVRHGREQAFKQGVAEGRKQIEDGEYVRLSEEYEGLHGGEIVDKVREEQDNASKPQDRSAEELEADLQESIQAAADGDTVSAEEARKEFESRETLEPASFLYEYDGEEWVKGEPLVRLSDLQELVDELERFTIGREHFIMDLRERLEEAHFSETR